MCSFSTRHSKVVVAGIAVKYGAPVVDSVMKIPLFNAQE